MATTTEQEATVKLIGLQSGTYAAQVWHTGQMVQTYHVVIK